MPLIYCVLTSTRVTSKMWAVRVPVRCEHEMPPNPTVRARWWLRAYWMSVLRRCERVKKAFSTNAQHSAAPVGTWAPGKVDRCARQRVNLWFLSWIAAHGMVVKSLRCTFDVQSKKKQRKKMIFVFAAGRNSFFFFSVFVAKKMRVSNVRRCAQCPGKTSFAFPGA